MVNDKLIKILYNKETSDAWDKVQKVEADCEMSNNLYDQFDIFKKMLEDEKSYIRMRGFRILCKLSKWDINNKVNDNINNMLNVLNDDKPTIVRMCLQTINDLVIYKPELSTIINNALKNIDLSKYRDTMRPLIKKDIDNITNSF